jgi:hypothetical protein
MPDESRSNIDEEIREAIFAGQKIRAIKLYREVSGAGLKEAKDFVEALAAELYARSPEKFTTAPASGCGTAAALLLLAPAVAWLWWAIV